MPEKDKPEEPLREALAALQRLSDAFARRRGQLARGAELTEAQWRVLEQIAAEDFMPSLFARRQEQTPAAVSKLIRQLLDRGLVEVSISSGDARQRRLRADRARTADHGDRPPGSAARASTASGPDSTRARCARFARFARRSRGAHGGARAGRDGRKGEKQGHKKPAEAGRSFESDAQLLTDGASSQALSCEFLAIS